MNEGPAARAGKGRIDEGGRILIPVEIRKAAGVKPGDGLVILLEDDCVKLLTMEQAVRRAQRLLGLPVARSLVDELLQERREEAARE